MNRSSGLLHASILGMTMLLPLTALVACNKTSAPAASAGAAVDTGAATAVFTANCSKCHSINGSGGKRGPDLSHTGVESEHTAQWLADFIKNPASKKPGIRMPGFEGKISDSDLKTLSEYLASLK